MQEIGPELGQKMETMLTVSEFMMLRFDEIGLLREAKEKNLDIVDIAKLRSLWKQIKLRSSLQYKKLRTEISEPHWAGR